MARRLHVRWEVTEVFEGDFSPEDLGVTDAGEDPNEADFATEALAGFEGNDAGYYSHTGERAVVDFEWRDRDDTGAVTGDTTGDSTGDDRPMTGWTHPEHLPGITVTTWHSDAGDGKHDGALVVQVDTDEHTDVARVRINLNDAPVWDGHPASDDRPGQYLTGDDTGDVTVSGGDERGPLLVAPRDQILTLARCAQTWGAAAMDHRKTQYAAGVRDALLLITGEIDDVPPGHPIHPIYQAYLREY